MSISSEINRRKRTNQTPLVNNNFPPRNHSVIMISRIMWTRKRKWTSLLMILNKINNRNPSLQVRRVMRLLNNKGRRSQHSVETPINALAGRGVLIYTRRLTLVKRKRNLRRRRNQKRECWKKLRRIPKKTANIKMDMRCGYPIVRWSIIVLCMNLAPISWKWCRIDCLHGIFYETSWLLRSIPLRDTLTLGLGLLLTIYWLMHWLGFLVILVIVVVNITSCRECSESPMTTPSVAIGQA